MKLSKRLCTSYCTILTYEPCRRCWEYITTLTGIPNLPRSLTTAMTVASGTLSLLEFQACRIGQIWALIKTSLVHTHSLNQANSLRECTNWKVRWEGLGRFHPWHGCCSTVTLLLVCRSCSNTVASLSTVFTEIF